MRQSVAETGGGMFSVVVEESRVRKNDHQSLRMRSEKFPLYTTIGWVRGRETEEEERIVAEGDNPATDSVT